MNRKSIGLLVIMGLAAFLFGPSPAFAAVTFGSTVQTFAVLGGSTVTNTGSSVITGNVGVSPGLILQGPAGFPPGLIVGGTFHAHDGLAGTAQTELTTAYNDAANPILNPCTADLTGQDLGGLTLTPGVYCFTSSAQLTGTLTLNFQGNSAAFFLFQIGSTLTTASASSVVLTNNPGTTCPTNLFWQVGSSATLGTTTSFVGNILALTSITLNTGAGVIGRTLARNGAVTLDTNTVNTATCAGALVCPTITLSPATLPPMTVGTAFSQTITASGGTAPYTFAVTSGALPAGLALTGATSTSVNITGTPTTAGAFSFTIMATDTSGCTGTQAYSGVVAAAIVCPTITLSPATLPPITVGTPFSQTITASGGTAPYTFAVTSGALPAGLALTGATSTSVNITGTPTTAGAFSFTIRATDTNGCTGTQAYSGVVAQSAVGGPTLDSFGLAILLVLLAVAGFLAVNRFTS